jgi:hypothetical protein
MLDVKGGSVYKYAPQREVVPKKERLHQMLGGFWEARDLRGEGYFQNLPLSNERGQETDAITIGL